MDIYKVNICLIGDSFTGKSTFLNCIDKNNFPKYYEETIGVDFKSVTYKTMNYFIKWNIWDFAGNKIYENITESYFKDISIFLLFFDISNNESFENLEYWLNRIKKLNLNKSKIFLICNKTDLPNNISDLEISKLKLHFIKTSLIKNGDINKITKVVNNFCKLIIDSEDYENFKIKLIKQNPINKKKSFWQFFNFTRKKY